jgi:hypothetical protein
MGKRSNFKRRPRDFYATPAEAVVPLMEFTNGIKYFAEPCAGKGDLIRHLESGGLHCNYSGDLARGRDALRYKGGGNIDAIITNPPHRRDILHPMILHFQSIAPTWLLIDLDWAANLQAVPYLKRCSDIVVIGRVKWIKNSDSTGKENYGWYRFDAGFRGKTRFHNRRAKP